MSAVAEAIEFPTVRETPDGLERLKLTRYELGHRYLEAWTTPVAYRVAVDEPWVRATRYSPVVLEAERFDSWRKVPPPMPLEPDERLGRRRGYERFRVTGWIEPGSWCDPETERAVKIDVTEPLDRHTVALMAMSREGRVAPNERYTRLTVNGRLWMSDTPDEYRDHVGFIVRAHGRVLIHGLGLGCSLKAILQKPEVEHVDVVEISEQVLAVVGPYFEQDARVNLIHGDALAQEWPKGSRWDVVWHDIWADKDEGNLDQYGRLNRRFARRSGWQGAWGLDHIRAMRRRGNAWGW